MKTKTLLYFAAPLFTQAEWQWNAVLAQQLQRHKFQIILPQARAEPMLDNKVRFDPRVLFEGNVHDVERSDFFFAVLDQADPDSGTCWECGYAYKLGKPIIGLRTDIRRSSDGPEITTNLMLVLSCAKFIEVPIGKRSDVAWVSREIAKAIRSLGP
jgi:nucleoside 2-deoxyribosyltransferase